MPVPHRRTAVIIMSLAVLLTACTRAELTQEEAPDPATVVRDDAPSPLHGTLLEPPLPRPTQVLRDTANKWFSLAQRPADELTVLFFGYTHCPDVCPITMADLAVARSQLPTPLRDRVTVVFVTEDPARDTPRLVRRWLDDFDPAFVGLRGGNESTEAILEQLYLPATKRLEKPTEKIKHPDTGGHPRTHSDYGIQHAGIVYAWGPGDQAVIYTGGTKPDEYAADFRRLLTEPGDR
jgi:protein SCO1/2